MNNIQQVISITIVSLLAITMVAEAGNLYRYRNHEGNLVIDYAVPPEYIPKGYEVLSEVGRVLEVFEPQPDPSEQVPLEQQQRAMELAAARLKEDEMLLTAYSDTSEIESAMVRRLDQLDREIEIIQSNLTKTAIALNELRQQAANYQMGGRLVPKSLLDSMAIQIEEHRDGEDLLLVRQQEHEGVQQRYMGYLKRFKELTHQRDL